jgi:predicted phage terminase large subunit-like protein
LIIADDLENEEQAQSEEQREKLRTWFRGTLLNTGHPHTNVVVVGTILHQDSLLAHLIDPSQSPGWTGRKYQAVESFSDNPQLWQQWSAIFRGRAENDGATDVEAAQAFFEAHQAHMLRGTSVLWPERESYHALMVMRETEGLRSFQSEKQNDPIDPNQCIFRAENITYWDDQYRDLQHLLESLGAKAEFYGACDPSLGRTARGDYTAIAILVRARDKKVNYVIAADLLHCSPSEAIERIVQYARLYRFRKFAVESNAFQQLMVEDLRRRMTAAGVGLKPSELTSRSNKQSRIAGLEPYVQQGFLRFCRRHTLLLDQLRQFPLAKNDDGPDALEMAMQLAQESRHITRIEQLG